jgi:hypothetical protein
MRFCIIPSPFLSMASILTKRQRLKFGPVCYTENDEEYRIIADVRYDDDCGNGHNTFSITARIDQKDTLGRWREYSGGCCHDEVAAHFPELAPFIKWHLYSSDGPMHYIANTIYHVQEKKLDYARSTAIWPDATDAELCADDLKEKLTARLPALLADFQKDMESLGFVF